MTISENRFRYRGATDKPLMPNELLVLASILFANCGSQYSLQNETSLSPGSVLRSLERLRSLGLLQVRDDGPRRRKRFSVTLVGEKELEREWNAALGRYIADFDSVLKLVKAGEWIDPPSAVEYAKKAADLRQHELSKYLGSSGQSQAPEVDVFSYGKYKELARFHQLQAEEATLRKLERALSTGRSAGTGNKSE